MEKEFVTYEQALALKELGFHKETSDKPFSYYYFSDGKFKLSNTMIDFEDGDLPAPLIQQAFRFFREKYGLYAQIGKGMIGECRHWYTINAFTEYGEDEGFFKAYEEAEQSCLNKLIEIARGTYKQD